MDLFPQLKGTVGTIQYDEQRTYKAAGVINTAVDSLSSQLNHVLQL